MVRGGRAGFAGPPDPGEARILDDLIRQLRLLKTWAGNPSYEIVTKRVNALWRAAGRPERESTAKNTVAACFTIGRARPNDDLVLGIVAALNPDPAYLERWRQALRIVRGEAEAATFVTAQSTLPDDITHFTGRETELTRLAELVDTRTGADGTPVVISVEGMAGVGKTQLVIHAGHLLLSRYNMDLVLFVDLRGFHPDPGQPPADPAAVLASFLRLLDVPGHAIPHDLKGRQRLYRQLLHDRQALIVLDNAATTAQIQPLLTNSPTCRTLVTSRRILADLPAAGHLRLDVFTPAEAVAFLTCALPHIRVGTDAHAPARIAHRCGHLPLALGVVAGYIRATSSWTLTDHADRLDERARDRRLDSDVELALDVSYQHLSADHRRLLRLAALHPGHDFDVYAAAALTGTDQATASTQLQQLHRDHLLQQPARGRYMFHDLVSAYATVRAGDEERPPERRAALTRLFDYYLAATTAAMDTVYPADSRRPRVATSTTSGPLFDARNQATTWLDTERPNLGGVVACAAETGFAAQGGQLAAILWRYLYTGAHYADAVAIHSAALRCARARDDPAAEGSALHNLGTIRWRLGEFDEAEECLRRALRARRQAHDLPGCADTLRNLGIVYQWQGRNRDALGCYRQALRGCQEVGNRLGEGTVLGNLAILYWAWGRYREAHDLHQQALTIAREIGDRVNEGNTLGNLGEVYARWGQDHLALDHLQQALVIRREVGDRVGEADVLRILGTVLLRNERENDAAGYIHGALGIFQDIDNPDGKANTLNDLGALHRHSQHWDAALDCHRQALAIARDITSRDAEMQALNGTGETMRAVGQLAEALEQHGHALALARHTGNRDEQARAHDGIAQVLHVTGRSREARRHWSDALAIYAELEVPDADRVRAALAALDEDA